jgi:alkylation response protein AidB-like acyl-CoA dehydrogenase
LLNNKETRSLLGTLFKRTIVVNSKNKANMYLAKASKLTQEKFPILYNRLSQKTMMEWENSSAETLAEVFRESQTAGALIPKENGGLGASAAEIASMIHWVAGKSPSLGLMMVMHHHSLGGLNAFSEFVPEMKQLTAYIASSNLLLASAFAEGNAHSDIFKLGIHFEKKGDGFVFNGKKRPCTMANVMDAMLLGLTYTNEAGNPEIGAAFIPRNSEGITSSTFWGADVLTNSDTHSVDLENVYVPQEQMLLSGELNAQTDHSNSESEPNRTADNAVSCWFQVLASSMYLGVAATLMNKALLEKNGHSVEKSNMLVDYESAMIALIATAEKIDNGIFDQPMLTQCLSVRYSTQMTIERISDRAFEILGGIHFIKNRELAYLLTACRLISFHPPSRSAASEDLLASYIS